MTSPNIDELVERLRDESGAMQRVAWSRPDGGQDCCISAALASQAATALEQLQAENKVLEAALRVTPSEITEADIEWAGNERIAELQARVGELEEGLRAIVDGYVPRPVGRMWRGDGKPSKNDRCTHDVWMYETCGNCIDDFVSALLSSPKMGMDDGR